MQNYQHPARPKLQHALLYLHLANKIASAAGNLVSICLTPEKACAGCELVAACTLTRGVGLLSLRRTVVVGLGSCEAFRVAYVAAHGDFGLVGVNAECVGRVLVW